MKTEQLFRRLAARGVSLTLDGNTLFVMPASRMTPALWRHVDGQRHDLARFINDAHHTTARLLAMRPAIGERANRLDRRTA